MQRIIRFLARVTLVIVIVLVATWVCGTVADRAPGLVAAAIFLGALGVFLVIEERT